MSAIQPETFKEICESVLEEADGRGVQIASTALGRDTGGDLYLTNPTHRNIVKWVAEEYQRIQLLSPNWEFHHKRGTFLNVAANKESYQKSGVRRVDDGSLYFVKSGETVRYPLHRCYNYDWWLYQQQYTTSVTSAVPEAIIEGPNFEWILWPQPTAAGSVKGDWWVEPFSLVNADDKTCWRLHYNPLLKWGVLNLYAPEFATEGSLPKIKARVQQMQPSLMLAFEGDYLPDVNGPPTLV